MVDEYEIEVRLQNKQTRKVVHETLTVYAYRVSDVPTQAIYALMKDRNVEEWDLKILSLGPPKRLIEASAQRVRMTVENIMTEIANLSKK
jgi:hypothetical protein